MDLSLPSKNDKEIHSLIKAFNLIPGMVFLLSSPGNTIISMNNQAETQLGYLNAEFLPFLSDLFKNKKDFQKYLTNIQRNGQSFLETEWLTRSGKTIQIRLSVRQIKNQSLLVLYAENITKIKSVEQSYFESQKMEAIGRLAGGIAHSFNNILNSIMGLSSIAMKETKPEDEIYADLKDIYSAGKKGAMITFALSQVSRKKPENEYSSNTASIVKNITSLFNTITGKGVYLKIHSELPSGELMCPQEYIQQILLNLFLNSRESIKTKGSIVISLHEILIDDNTAPLFPEAEKKAYACFQIADTGEGMKTEVRKHCTEPYFSTRKGHSGLGLSTSYSMIRICGGWTRIHSLPEKGTTVTFFIPFQSEKKGNKIIQNLQPHEITKGLKILFVEDDDQLRQVTSRLLKDMHHTVIATSTVKAGLHLMKEEIPDLIISDIILPDKPGTIFLDKAPSGIPVILTSTFLEGISLKDDILKKGHFFLMKPYTLNDLNKALREINVKPREN